MGDDLVTLPELATVLTEARRIGIARERAALLVAAVWWKLHGFPIPGIEAWLRTTWPPESKAEAADQAAEPGGWKIRFLAELAAGHDITMASDLAGVTRRMAYKASASNEEFKLAWDAAVLEGRRRQAVKRPAPLPQRQ